MTNYASGDYSPIHTSSSIARCCRMLALLQNVSGTHTTTHLIRNVVYVATNYTQHSADDSQLCRKLKPISHFQRCVVIYERHLML